MPEIYTDATFHAGGQSGAVSVKDADELAASLNAMDTAVEALDTSLTLAKAVAATATALTGVAAMTGTLDNAMSDDATNKNVKELATQVNALIVDVAALKAALI